MSEVSMSFVNRRIYDCAVQSVCCCQAVLAVDMMLLEDRTGLATRGLAKLKAKLSLCIIKHHAMKMYGGQSSNSTHLTKEWKCVISLVCVYVW